MKSTSNWFSRGVLCGAILSMCSSLALADSLVVNPLQSSLTFGIEVGIYTEEGNPASFAVLATAIGQGGVPVGPGKLPGPVTPGYSSGLSAQLSGTIAVTPAAFSIDSAKLSLLDSGSWQPGTNTNPVEGEFTYDHVAVPADLGGFLEGYLFAEPPAGPDFNATALLDAIDIGLAGGAVALGGGGEFTDPSGAIALNGGLVSVESNLGSFGSSITEPVSQVVGFAGTFTGGVLLIPVDSFFDVEVPTDLITVIARISVLGQVKTAIPGDANFDESVDGGDYTLWADNYLETGQSWGDGDFNGDGIVDGGDYTIWADHYDPVPAMASAVPEPSTFALLGVGTLILLGGYYRRRN